MKKSTDERLTHIEEMMKLIHDHLMDLHRLAECALVAELEAASAHDVSTTFPLPPSSEDVH